MNHIRFRKERLSIQLIGKQRFWVGVVAGLITAISISLFFNYSREIIRLFTTLSDNLLILKDKELLFFNIFFSLLSSLLGLSISIWIWMQNKKHNRRKDRIYKQISINNAFLVFWVVFMVISRFGSILPLILFNLTGYNNHLNLYEDFRILFVLLPIVVFMQSWFSVRLVYKAGRWIFISFLIVILTAFILYFTTTVNQEILNDAHKQKIEIKFIDVLRENLIENN